MSKKLFLLIGLFAILLTMIDFLDTPKPKAMDISLKTDPSNNITIISGVIISDYVQGGGLQHDAFKYKNFAKYRISSFKKTIPLKYSHTVDISHELKPMLADAEVSPESTLVINWQPILILIFRNLMLSGFIVIVLSQIIDKIKSKTNTQSV